MLYIKSNFKSSRWPETMSFLAHKTIINTQSWSNDKAFDIDFRRNRVHKFLSYTLILIFKCLTTQVAYPRNESLQMQIAVLIHLHV